MKNYVYFHTLRDTLIQFLDQFNNITVKRYDETGTVIKTIGKVPLRVGPKSKIWNFLEQRDFDVVLPTISVHISGITFDAERHAGATTSQIINPDYGGGLYTKVERPTPYNVSYKMTLWAKYIEDMNQILENILPFFTPYTFITITGPSSGDFLNLKCALENASQTTGEDYGVEERRVLTWDLEFVVSTWLYKVAEENQNLIKKIYAHYWGYDATVVYSNIDGTVYTVDSAKGAFNSQNIEKTVDWGNSKTGGVLDWDYGVYSPGDLEGPPSGGYWDGEKYTD